MKKLVFRLFILLIMASFVQSCDKSKNQNAKRTNDSVSKNKAILPTQISLNGFLINDADGMINEFIYNRKSDDNTKTNVWFKKRWLHNIYLLLTKEHADGIRIYFARDANGNNIVVVSTRDGGVNPKVPSGANHIDYFEHTANFLNSEQTNGDIVVDHGLLGSGATLYNSVSPCTTADCSILPEHDLKCTDAYSWVGNYSLAMSDNTNTTSEWFDFKLIEKLDEELQKTQAPDGPDGLRIYFAKRKADNILAFVMVTTKNVAGVHKDYFDCYQNPVSWGGDNGEQCPTNCSGTTWP